MQPTAPVIAPRAFVPRNRPSGTGPSGPRPAGPPRSPHSNTDRPRSEERPARRFKDEAEAAAYKVATDKGCETCKYFGRQPYIIRWEDRRFWCLNCCSLVLDRRVGRYYKK